MPRDRHAIGDESKPLEHNFTAYDTPCSDIRLWLRSRVG